MPNNAIEWYHSIGEKPSDSVGIQQALLASVPDLSVPIAPTRTLPFPTIVIASDINTRPEGVCVDHTSSQPTKKTFGATWPAGRISNPSRSVSASKSLVLTSATVGVRSHLRS